MARKEIEDDDVKSANEAAGEEFQRALAEEKGEERKAERGKEIDVDEEDDEEQAREPQEERATRAEKRRARKSQFEQAQRERDDYRRQVEELQRSTAEMRGQLQGFLASQQRPNSSEQSQKSMEELALENAERAVYDVHREFNSLPDQEKERRLEEYQQKWAKAERSKNEAQYRYFASKNQQPQPRQVNSAEIYLNAHAADVMSQGERGLTAIQTNYVRLVKLRGEPDNLETLTKAANMAREDLGLTRKAPPITTREPGLREKLRAPGQGPQGSGGDRGERRVVRMGGNSSEEKARRQMAQAMYPKLSPEKAYERYAKTVLKEQLEAGEIDS